MAKFRKKPVVIEAMQFDGNIVLSKFQDWLMKVDPERKCLYVEDKLTIRTLEGVMTADIGDYVIQGVKGELYPCKPDIFAATYDAVIDSDNG
jgi:hypothetical protein